MPTAAGSDTLSDVSKPPATAQALLRRAAALRDEVGLLDTDVRDVHRDIQRHALDERTTDAARADVAALLESLLNRGLSQSLVGRLVGVSHTAVRKWRRGEPAGAENRRRVARLVATLDMVSDQFPIGDPASWIEMPISDASTLTPGDLYAANRHDLILDLAGSRNSAVDTLDAFDPDWRSRWAKSGKYQVVIAGDDQPSIRRREDM